MLKLLLVACLLGLTYASPSGHKSHRRIRGRIVNGTNAEEGEFPFAKIDFILKKTDFILTKTDSILSENHLQPHENRFRTSSFEIQIQVIEAAVLRDASFDNMQLCGTSILNKNYVLTAGHCVDCEAGETFDDPSEFNIQYGLIKITTDDTNSVNIKKIYCNNLTRIYDGDYYESVFDTAVLELATPLPDDGSWKPVTLSRVFDSTVQQEGVIIGWGDDLDIQTTVLQKLTLNIYNDTVCGAATRGDWDHHVCVGSIEGGTGPCYGDSGTAALVNGIQVGITSYLTVVPPECARGTEATPDIYARVEKYFDWIKNITPDIQSN